MRYSLQNNTSYSNINVLYNSCQTSIPSLFSERTEQYSYGFNGKENDREVTSTGSGTQDYGARIYNPSLGKFLSVDPIANLFAWNSTYAFCENRPLDGIDLEGKEWSSSGKVFNYMTGKTEINQEIKIKTVNEKGVASKSVTDVVNMIIPQVEDILGNQFAKGTTEDPVVTVKVIQDKNASISLRAPLFIMTKRYNSILAWFLNDMCYENKKHIKPI